MKYTVFYMNPRATPDVCRTIEEQMPSGWELRTPGTDGDLSAGLAACDFILVADHPVSAEHILAAPGLRMIQHQGVGYERIDLAACRGRGIPVGLTPDGTSVGVAEHTILLILALYKQLVRAATGVRQGRWMQWELRGGSFELAGKTLGLVGYGRIGREVARRALAFDANVLYYDPIVQNSGSDGATRVASLAELLRRSDIVSLHVPLTPDSRYLINSHTLGQMKPGAVLINTSRGGLVDEDALAQAIIDARIAGAALDVLSQEPPSPDHPLLKLPNVLITPHIAAGTHDALVAKMRAAFANMLRHTRGEPLLNVVPELSDLNRPAAPKESAAHAAQP